jgi:hypothetical protein
MSASAVTARTGAVGSYAWLRDRNWDLTWISLSVVLVAVPYLIYIGVTSFGGLFLPVATALGTTVDDLGRNLINAAVGLAVGGPHMYCTFTRTVLDRDFAKLHPRFLWSSLLIPAAIVTLALINLPLLLTLFFLWASIHVLHQIIYIVELYNHRQLTNLSLFSRLSDYAVVLTALYPLAAWKISQGNFMIGTNNLSAIIAQFVPLGPWMVWLAGGAFGIALITWIVKSAIEQSQGRLHIPKTVFIGLTVLVSFPIPALGNLDTAFQGMNVWHSLQYLALTWMLNNLRQKRGELKDSPLVQRLSTDGSARRYYSFNMLLTLGDILLAAGIYAIMTGIFKMTFDYAFDRAYYIAILSFLLVHYYHDHYLFTKPGVISS